jgi:AraC-like DNA-binding protein
MMDGSLLVSSYRGRERLERGMLAIRPTFDARAFRAGPGGAAWLQLPWFADTSLGASHAAANVDGLMLLAVNDLVAAQAAIADIATRSAPLPVDRQHWIDNLHQALLAEPDLTIAGWARANRVSREATARSFRAAYDVRPSRFRLEVRARMAWCRIIASDDPLSLIALESGFADQSHMTRAVGWLTGRPPAAWRKPGAIGPILDMGPRASVGTAPAHYCS